LDEKGYLVLEAFWDGEVVQTRVINLNHAINSVKVNIICV